MQKLIGAAVLASLTALAMPVQAEVVINASNEIDLVVFVSCANGGAGELVELHGSLHSLTTFTINRHTFSGKSHFQPQGISGVGVDTGVQISGRWRDPGSL
jgi:hypothetical protein